MYVSTCTCIENYVGFKPLIVDFVLALVQYSLQYVVSSFELTFFSKQLV